ncbi:MAG: hypothetical protein N2663_04870 [Chlorobi bacterium]|nr:hypothetical protein [Chlorobiota bacterium]
MRDNFSHIAVEGAIAIVAAIVLAGAAATGVWYVLAGIIAGLVAVVFMVKVPRLHWLAFFAILPVYFRQNDADVTIFDAGMAAYLATLLTGWFVWAITVRRYQLVWERKDVFLWIALIATLLSGLSATMQGGRLFDWAREWALVAMAAYYFVFRSAFATADDFRFFTVLLVLMTLGLSVTGLLTFRQQIFEALYAYQIRGVKGVNAVYLIGFLLSISLLLYRERWWERLLWFLSAGVIGSGIVISYTRTVWAGAAVAIVTMLVLLPALQRIRLAVALSVAGTLSVVIGWIVLGPTLPLVGKILGHRAATIINPTKQISVAERRDETQHLLRMLTIPQIALAGIGPGTKFVFYDSSFGKTVRSHFVHSGVLALLIKFGIPIGGLLYLFHLMMLVKSLRCYLRSRRTQWEPYVLPFTLSLLGSTVMDWTTNAFVLRSGFLYLAMLYAGVVIAERLLQQNYFASGEPAV